MSKISTRRRGRPSVYTEEIAGEICERIAKGESLRSIGRDPRMPCRDTVLNWLLDGSKQDFFDRYARARYVQADVWHDEMINLADESPKDKLEIQKRRLQIDTRRWLCAVAKPNIYGNKVEVKNTVTHIPHEETIRRLREEQRLERLKAEGKLLEGQVVSEERGRIQGRDH